MVSYAQQGQAHLLSEVQKTGMVKGVAHIAFLQHSSTSYFFQDGTPADRIVC